MSNVILDTQEKHLIPKGIRPIHQKYGLWICKFCRGQTAKPVQAGELCFRHFEFYDISHMFDGRGWYCASNGSIRKVEKGDGILVTPGSRHKYGGDREPYIEDSISFYGPVADQLFNAGIISNGILKIGKARRLLPIIELAQDSSDAAQVKANLALQTLLVELHFENKKSNNFSFDSALEQLLEEIKKSPQKWWDINSMAEFCNISPSQFKRLFRKKTNMSPKGYLDNFKMQMAAEMLSDRSAPIKNIAAALGYLDQYHFSRRFKQLTGHTPTDYRQFFCH